MYAKLINGAIECAPSNIIKDNIVYSNYDLESNDQMLREDGYKPIIEVDAPTEMKKPQKYYEENEDFISVYYVETYVEPTYYEKRALNYPDFHEYLDAQVKINSGNAELIAEGTLQAQNYYSQCIEIKNTYPKE